MPGAPGGWWKGGSRGFYMVFIWVYKLYKWVFYRLYNIYIYIYVCGFMMFDMVLTWVWCGVLTISMVFDLYLFCF